jgi:hypothetical protein
MGKVFVHRRFGSTKLAKPLTLDEQVQARLAEERRRQQEEEAQRQQHRAERIATMAKYRAEMREFMQEYRTLPRDSNAEVACYKPELVRAVASVRTECVGLKDPRTGKFFTGQQLTEIKVANRYLNKFATGMTAHCLGCGFDITSVRLFEFMVPHEVVVVTLNGKRIYAAGLCADCMNLPPNEKAAKLIAAINSIARNSGE